ncbi:myozenin-1-like isoform X1 [Oncorhynchus keta]|uniref:myozenin-1-like isoform X1 n=1 Tax=Oncorhynchus keta TaxID=8018 RepID=UPI00227D0F9E|nr:myozenin-1-like isoform X1 [Oncorhynchus keta]
MPLSISAHPNKRKKVNKIITDLTNITQDDEESNPEASEFDLGTKINTPKDTMLEELSLLTNKGSKMFRMRQQRVEHFIVTNENMQNLQQLVPSLGCETTAPPLTQELEHEEDKEAEEEKKRQQYVQTYVSPWERAMRGDESLTSTMHHHMAGPHTPHDMPKFKSFNRTALPYGGSENAGGHLTFEPPEIQFAQLEAESLHSLQGDIRSRPSFNRTPIGWVCNLEDNSHIHMELDNMLPFDGETDDL